jgi:hypothetical protein
MKICNNKKSPCFKVSTMGFLLPYFVTFLDENFVIKKKSPCFKVSTMDFLLPYFVTFLDENFAVVKKALVLKCQLWVFLKRICLIFKINFFG